MRVLVLGAALLAGAIPAFGQTPVAGNCEAALVTPGVPSAIVVLTVPGPASYAAATGSPHSVRSPAVTAGYPGSTNPSSSSASAVVWAGGAASGIGSMGTTGIGTMRSSGIGSMERSGIGSIGGANVGTIVPSGAGLAPTTLPSLPPVAAQPIFVGPPGTRGNTIPDRPVAATRAIPFICP